jgi:hypothetical protein
MAISIRVTRPVLLTGTLLLVAFSASAFGSSWKPTIKMTPQGQLAAKVVVLTKSDFARTPGWVGGAVQVDAGTSESCAEPGTKAITLVENGDQKTEFAHGGIEVSSGATVLATAAMVRADWLRHAGPHLVSCMHRALVKSSTANARIVSVSALPFPHMTTYLRAIRITLLVKEKTGSVRVVTDMVLFGRGRTEGVFTTTARPVHGLLGFEEHFVLVMANRMGL